MGEWDMWRWPILPCGIAVVVSAPLNCSGLVLSIFFLRFSSGGDGWWVFFCCRCLDNFLPLINVTLVSLWIQEGEWVEPHFTKNRGEVTKPLMERSSWCAQQLFMAQDIWWTDRFVQNTTKCIHIRHKTWINTSSSEGCVLLFAANYWHVAALLLPPKQQQIDFPKRRHRSRVTRSAEVSSFKIPNLRAISGDWIENGAALGSYRTHCLWQVFGQWNLGQVRRTFGTGWSFWDKFGPCFLWRFLFGTPKFGLPGFCIHSGLKPRHLFVLLWNLSICWHSYFSQVLFGRDVSFYGNVYMYIYIYTHIYINIVYKYVNI